MSRRRYISTEISVDRRIRYLSDSAALLYTWMIPHVEEDATITSDCEEIAAIVVPNRPGWTTKKVAACLDEIVQQGLVNKENGTLYFPVNSFYKYQSNIHQDRRRVADPGNACKSGESAQNSAEQRESAQNSASFSSSPSSSSSISSKSGDSDSSEFTEFWQAYPRKQGKGNARPAYAKALKKAAHETIMAGLKYQLPGFAKKERKYIPLPATWLNGERWEDEVEGVSPATRLSDEPLFRKGAGDLAYEADRAKYGPMEV